MNNFFEFVNKIFEVCAEYATVGVHYEKEDNGQRCWNNTLHNVIQEACMSISKAFEDFDAQIGWEPDGKGNYVCGDYALTEVNNAFNDKQSFWISKKGYTRSFYCFTPINDEDLHKQLDDPHTWIDYFEKQVGGLL